MSPPPRLSLVAKPAEVVEQRPRTADSAPHLASGSVEPAAHGRSAASKASAASALERKQEAAAAEALARRESRRLDWKEPPAGSFGAGGWGPGGNGKYRSNQMTFESCEKARATFRKLCIRKYGTVVGAWKSLDTNSDGELSYFEFMRGLQSMGLPSGARDLWCALDLDRSGKVSVAEVDPDLAELLGDLALLIWSVFGTVEQAWRSHFNRLGKMRIGLEEFSEACNELNFPGDCAVVFKELATDRATNGISRKEFGFLHHWISNGEPDRIGSDEPVSRWAIPTKHWEPPPPQPKGPEAMKEFKELLLKSYANFVRAWRLGLDYDHNGYMDYKEFTRAAKDVGFAGNLRELWTELDVSGNGVVSIWELDLPTAQALKEFTASAQRTFGSWQNAWRDVMDIKSDDRVQISQFLEGCKLIGYTGDAERTFELLDVDRVKYLSWKTVDWLEGTELSPDKEKDRMDLGNLSISGQFQSSTVSHQRRYENNARGHRVRSKTFEGRARGEIPGSNPAAGTSMFSPGQTLNSHMLSTSSSVPSLSSSTVSNVVKGYRRSIPEPELPQWLLAAEGRAKSPEPLPKKDLSFPLKPQAPGKGGWPCSKIRLVDELWGGSKDIGANLSAMSRRACPDRHLARWRKQAQRA